MIRRLFTFLYCILFYLSPAYAQSDLKNPFAVVELFTSEGCASCPPADLLLKELTAAAQKQNKPIYTLSFHVDYWNYLGWRDPFSNRQNTLRQYQYARSLKSDSVYTPQMIINGQMAFSGHRQDLAFQSIEQALTKNNELSLAVEISDQGPGTEINFALNGFPPKSVLNIALVERGLSNDVTAGENAGERLSHANVVKVFESIPLTKNKGTHFLDIPSSVNRKMSSIIIYVQEINSMKILAAKGFAL